MAPHPSPLSRHLAQPATYRKTEKKRTQVADGKGGGGWAKSESYDYKKAWSFIIHTIFSNQTISLFVDAKINVLQELEKVLAHHLPPSPVSKLDRRHTGRLRNRYKLLKERKRGGGGVAEESNHPAARKKD